MFDLAGSHYRVPPLYSNAVKESGLSRLLADIVDSISSRVRRQESETGTSGIESHGLDGNGQFSQQELVVIQMPVRMQGIEAKHRDRPL